MTEDSRTIARDCLDGAETGRLNFPRIVGRLQAAGFEGYCIDFRRGDATYYNVGGASIILPSHAPDSDIAPRFDPAAMAQAVREAQQQVPGYTYAGFCEKAARAGCAAYFVSFPGRRVTYFGRTGETHVEHFPS